MKKILFFIDTLGHGGAEKVMINLVNNLNKEKYDITVMTIFDCGVNKKYLDKGIKYKYIFKRVFRGNVTLCKCFTPEFLYRHIIKDRYDTLIAYLEGNTTRILSGCHDKGIKKLAWIHVEMSAKTLFRAYRSKAECIKAYRGFDKIVGVSRTVLDSFENNTGTWDNLCVRYNTVETEYITERSHEPIADIEMPKEELKLVTVGRLIEQKSYLRLLRIHKRLLENHIYHKLYIIGEGEQERLLREYIRDNKLENTAFLLGFKENPWKYVKKADLFVCSSWKEGFSTAVTESLIAGTPVVTTLCSGMKEMLGESEYGLIVENEEQALYEGIRKLLTDENLLQYYKNMAVERGKQFDTKTTVRKVEELLDEE